MKECIEIKKKEIRSLAKTERDRNSLKRMNARIKSKTEDLYMKGRKRHQEKIKFLLKKHKGKIEAYKLQEEKRQERLNKIAQGRQVDKKKSIPMYGEVPQISDNAKEVLLLPRKQKILDKVTVNGMHFESNLCNTKLRWGRMTLGNLEEQAQELSEQLEQGLPSEDQYHRDQVLENLNREIYNPDTKTFDLGKLKCTDMRDNPRLYLPPPRPQREESLLQAKKEQYLNACKEYMKKNCNS